MKTVITIASVNSVWNPMCVIRAVLSVKSEKGVFDFVLSIFLVAFVKAAVKGV